MPSVNEIKRHYGGEQAKIQTRLFDLGHEAQHVDVTLDPDVRANLSEQDLQKLAAAEGVTWAAAERAKLKEKYIELELERVAAIEARVEEIELLLVPKNAGFADFAAAATATPEALIAAMDMAIASGDEDAALVAFAAGRQRDIEEVTSHAVTVREDWADLYAELSEAVNEPELDPGDKFELYAQPAPTKETILGAPQSGINQIGMLR